MRRAWYEIRWWAWFLSDGIYPRPRFEEWKLTDEDRQALIDSINREKDKREPSFNGTYPHRVREDAPEEK